jgi:hypothetical protein
MSFYFNGRNWVSPATMSSTNISGLAARSPNVSGSVLALIGNCTGGQSGKVMSFTDPTTAQNTLVSGELCQAAVKAFNPSPDTQGPSTVLCIRVNPGTPATLNLMSTGGSPAAQVNLSSVPVGAQANLITVAVTEGSLNGYMVTETYGSLPPVTQDNIARNAFSLTYSGSGTASANVTGTSLSLTYGATGSQTTTSVPFAQYATYQDVVNFVNTLTGWTASTLNGNGTLPSASTLDYQTALAVAATPVAFTANLQALVDWFNSPASPYINATRVAGVGATVAAISATSLSGGTDTTPQTSDWGNALNLLQTQDVQWLTVLTSNTAVQAMCDTHCQYMSTTGRNERRAYNGTALSTSDASAEAAATAFNSRRTSLVHLGNYDYDVTGQQSGLILWSPYMTAALVAAGFAGMTPGSAMTNKRLNVEGLERYLRNPDDTDPLLLAGVTPVEQDVDGSFRVTQSITTWLSDQNEGNTKVSVVCALDVTARTVRDAVNPLRGQKGNPALMTLALENAETALNFLAKPEPLGPGVLVDGGPSSPAYSNLTVSISNGDVEAVQFSCQVVDCVDYIPVTIYAQAYSGSVSATANA